MEQIINLKFVSEVEKHPVLYNYKIKWYSRRDFTENAWSDVGKEMNLTDQVRMASPHIILFGSPLIDITVKVDKTFLNNYNLKPKDACKMGKQHANIFEEILSFGPIIQTGGSITNTARVLKWLVNENNVTITYFGTIGDDHYGKIIKQQLESENINCVLKEIAGKNTGKVAALISDKSSRCLVTDLGASQIFRMEDYQTDIDSVVVSAQYLYFSGFFLNVNQDLMKNLIDKFSSHEKKTIFNLGAPFLISSYKKDYLRICDKASVVFGNDLEYSALIESVNSSSTKDFKEGLRQFSLVLPTKKNRTFVITRGSRSVYVFHNSQFLEFELEPLSDDDIEDTTAAGDAFVGGFLSQYLLNRPLDNCVKCGIFAAKEILKNVGCSFDKNVRF